MRKTTVTVALAAAWAASPVMAVGIEDWAKVVLGGGAVLKKAEQNCTGASLAKNDQLALTFARAAAEQALPISQFQQLDQSAAAAAEAEAGAKGFCTETKRKKSGMMAKIKKAGKALVKARVLRV